MHCKVCNSELSDFEATRKDANSYLHLDMCNACISGAGISTLDRMDLATADDLQYFDTLDDSWKYDNWLDV
jgi:hypothetical protein